MAIIAKRFASTGERRACPIEEVVLEVSTLEHHGGAWEYLGIPPPETSSIIRMVEQREGAESSLGRH